MNEQIKPIFLEVSEQLRADIVTGKYASGSRLPTENELADTYGISRMTLHKSLTLLEKQGLIVKHQGRGIFVCHDLPVRGCRIGIVCSHMTQGKDPYFNEIVSGALTALTVASSDSVSIFSFDPEWNKRTLLQHMSFYDGFIVPGSCKEAVQMLAGKEFDRFPLVYFGWCSPEEWRKARRCCVDLVPGELGKAFEYLYRRGHRRIAYAGPDIDNPHFKDRAETYLRMMKEYSLEILPGYYNIRSVDYHDFLAKRCISMMTSKTPPTAVLCGSSAIGLLRGAAGLKLHVPDDLEIIGFDGKLYPLIPELAQPTFEMAEKACCLLLNMIRTGKTTGETYAYEAKLLTAPHNIEPTNLKKGQI